MLNLKQCFKQSGYYDARGFLHACWTERYLSLCVVPSWDFAPSLMTLGIFLQSSLPSRFLHSPFSIWEKELGLASAGRGEASCGCSSSLISVQLINQPLQLSSFGLWVFITCLKPEASLQGVPVTACCPPLWSDSQLLQALYSLQSTLQQQLRPTGYRALH